MFNTGSVFFGGISFGFGAIPLTAISADNGVTIEPGNPPGDYVIELGSVFGSSPVSNFLTSREIDTNGNIISFDIFGNWTMSSGNQEYLFIGQNPYSGVHGVNFGLNYTTFPPGTVGGLSGYCISAVDSATTFAWARAENNDGFVFGYLYSFGAGVVAIPRIDFWDSGNTTFVSQAGNYPQSQDIDTGFTWGFFGTMGLLDQPTGNEIAFYSAYPEINLSVNSLDWSVVNPSIQLNNLNVGFAIEGINTPSLGGDIIQLTFFNGSIIFTQNGNIAIVNEGSALYTIDSGNACQVWGNLETQDNTGGTGDAGSIYNGSTQTNVGGSVSGNVIFSQPEKGSSYKKVIIYLDALIGTANFIYPVSFINTPVILTTNGLAAAIVTAYDVNSVTVTGANDSGFLIIEGF